MHGIHDKDDNVVVVPLDEFKVVRGHLREEVVGWSVNKSHPGYVVVVCRAKTHDV